ncbi:hypothetical protein LJB81_03985, partial [Desulfovibrio sp. OttesenSCG-928-M14]|nr:hypothetical protein [Desulfovibrio sp. OttesenSCG-928-M14]
MRNSAVLTPVSGLSDKSSPLFAKEDLVVVVGVGASGRAAARLLAALGARVRLADNDPGHITD